MKKTSIVVVDNGAATIKLGVVHGKAKVVPRFVRSVYAARTMLITFDRIVQNAIVRSKGDKTTYIGQEIGSCRDFSSLHYRLPFEKVRWLLIRHRGPSFHVCSIRRGTSSTGMHRRQYGTISSRANILEYVVAVIPRFSLTNTSFQVAPSEASLLMTEPYFNLPNLQDVYDQFVFEEYEFQSYYRCTRKFVPWLVCHFVSC